MRVVAAAVGEPFQPAAIGPDAVDVVVSAGLVGPYLQQEELRKLAKGRGAKPVPEEEPVV